MPEEAAIIAAEGKPLIGLEGIGPSRARRLHIWFDSPRLDIDPPPTRREFLARAQARRILAKKED